MSNSSYRRVDADQRPLRRSSAPADGALRSRHEPSGSPALLSAVASTTLERSAGPGSGGTSTARERPGERRRRCARTSLRRLRAPAARACAQAARHGGAGALPAFERRTPLGGWVGYGIWVRVWVVGVKTRGGNYSAAFPESGVVKNGPKKERKKARLNTEGRTGRRTTCLTTSTTHLKEKSARVKQSCTRRHPTRVGEAYMLS